MISGLSFSQVLITEIADPNNDADARFIELYNMGASPVDFTEGSGWQIDKYTNASGTVSLTLDLTGTIPAGGFYIIAYDLDPGIFQTTYGFAPDQLDAVSNGVAGSNGDDDIVLVDGTDTIVDFFGVPATDNTSTCAEYEDGRAERLTSVTGPNATFDESEWNVWADSTVAGCTSHQNAPRSAPGDYDPGAWGTPTCGLSLTNSNATCDDFTPGTDTYTATVDFTGGGDPALMVLPPAAGSLDLSMGDPSMDATGTITVNNIPEGTDITITVQDGGVCDVSAMISSPVCEPSLSLPLYEGFDYTVAEDLNNQADWTGFNGGSSIGIGGPGGLTYTGLANDSQTGNHLAFQGSGQESKIEFTGVTSGTVYASFIMQITDLSLITDLNDGGYFAALANDDSSYDLRVWVHPDTDPVGTTFDMAITATTFSPTFAGSYNINEAVLVVMSYEPGTGVIKGWVNPSSLGGAEPTPDFSETDPNIETIIDRFVLRQDSNGETPSILFDELRIGTSYAEVTPLTLSDNDFNLEQLSMYPNPTDTGMVTITSPNNDPMNVQVFDILGKQVKNENLSNNTLNVSELRAGIYIVKITQNNASTTKKLVIR